MLNVNTWRNLVDQTVTKSLANIFRGKKKVVGGIRLYEWFYTDMDIDLCQLLHVSHSQRFHYRIYIFVFFFFHRAPVRFDYLRMNALIRFMN